MNFYCGKYYKQRINLIKGGLKISNKFITLDVEYKNVHLLVFTNQQTTIASSFPFFLQWLFIGFKFIKRSDEKDRQTNAIPVYKINLLMNIFVESLIFIWIFFSFIGNRNNF